MPGAGRALAFIQPSGEPPADEDTKAAHFAALGSDLRLSAGLARGEA